MSRPQVASALVALAFLGGSTVLVGCASGETEPASEERRSKPPAITFGNDARVVAYQLNRLANHDLVSVERRPDPTYRPVYEEFLTRKGLDRKYRDEALDALVRLKQSDAVTEILAAIQGVSIEQAEEDEPANGAESPSPVGDLTQMLLERPSPDLQKRQQLLRDAATSATTVEERRAAYAALIMSAPARDVWKLASNSEEGLVALMQALPLVPDLNRIEPYYPDIRSLAATTGEPELRRAIIDVVPAYHQHADDAFKMLSGFIQAGVERDAAVHALRKIPAAHWDKDGAATLVRQLLAYIEAAPEGQRTDPRFLEAVELCSELTALLDSNRRQQVRSVLTGYRVRTLVIETVPDQMRFDKEQLVAEVGERIQIVFINRDYMLHNFVITVPGSLQEVGTAAEMMPADADAGGRSFVPALPSVLHATRLVGPNEEGKLSFVAPRDPGAYPYLCSFPGHWRLMSGELLLVEDIEKHETDPSRLIAGPKLTEWKAADLAPDLPSLSPQRSARGREVFTEAGCVRCHRYGGMGAEFGPDLTDVFTRWDSSYANAFKRLLEPADTLGQRFTKAADVVRRQESTDSVVLTQILDPSVSIRAGYSNHAITLENGSVETGLLLSETQTSLTLRSGPGQELVKRLEKADVADRRELRSSLMPSGLLGALTKEQILDLLAFLKYGSDGAAHHSTQ